MSSWWLVEHCIGGGWWRRDTTRDGGIGRDETSSSLEEDTDSEEDGFILEEEEEEEGVKLIGVKLKSSWFCGRQCSGIQSSLSSSLVLLLLGSGGSWAIFMMWWYCCCLIYVHQPPALFVCLLDAGRPPSVGCGLSTFMQCRSKTYMKSLLYAWKLCHVPYKTAKNRCRSSLIDAWFNAWFNSKKWNGSFEF